MPAQGGYVPGFERYGGGVPTLKHLLDSLNQQRGTAYNTSTTSPVWVENMAIARAINDVWDTNQRLGSQNDPARMLAAVTLPRWEQILGITPSPSDAEPVRRARIQSRFARFGQQVTPSVVSAKLSAALGMVFVALQQTTPANVVQWWPANPNADPVTVPWSSTYAHTVVFTQKPAGWTEGQYRQAIAPVFPLLDSLLPSWATWDVVHADSVNGILGWYLDSPYNLDFDLMEV